MQCWLAPRIACIRAAPVTAAPRPPRYAAEDLLSAGTRMGAVELLVSDLDTMVAYYSDAITLDVLAHAGAARVAHNWALARVKAVMDQRTAERSYGIAEELLTPSLSWSLAGLRKAWNAAKPVVAPWWGEVSKEVLRPGLDGDIETWRNTGDACTEEVQR